MYVDHLCKGAGRRDREAARPSGEPDLRKILQEQRSVAGRPGAAHQPARNRQGVDDPRSDSAPLAKGDGDEHGREARHMDPPPHRSRMLKEGHDYVGPRAAEEDSISRGDRLGVFPSSSWSLEALDWLLCAWYQTT